ncbi:TPR domain protein, putative component of TonB system [Olavius sp. associated proteobacterium Delta 1]|nr:TPR domain protein, putative component of TonB system [Olavius sp. associated proteobacterium Delta 1]
MANSDSSIKNVPRHETLLLFLLAVIIILVYTETLTSPFIFDDIHNIRDNPHIRVPVLSFKNLAWAGFQSPLANRPVANISFALNYYFHGYNLVGFHVVNILIHITSGIFLYFLVKATIRTPALGGRYAKFGWIPFFTAFIWLVHPLQTQSVTYLVQRMNSLAAMFYVLSLLLYVKFRLSTGRRAKWPFLGGCILTGMLAFGTKEISATLPGFIILYEWYFFQELSRQWAKRHMLILAGFGVFIIAISLAYFGNDPFVRILNDYNSRDFTLVQRVLTQFRVVIFYISLLIWPQPLRLSLDHEIALSYSLTNPITTLLSMTIIIVLILLAILLAKREPLISFCILWFFGNLVIESSIIGLELVFEHRNYLPSMLAILLLVALVFRYLKPVWLGVVALCVVGTLFTVWTFERNKDWSDEISLYRDCVEKAPGKARPYNNLGAALLRAGSLAKAVEQFKTALKIKPDFVDAHYNLGYALSRQGNLAAGIYQFGETLRLDPDNLKALNNMGVALALQGRYGQAVNYFEAALEQNPRDADVHNNLGIALKNKGNPDDAAKHFARALALDPRHADAHNSLGLILMESGQVAAANQHFARALEINPDFKDARRNLENRGQVNGVGSGNAEVGVKN